MTIINNLSKNALSKGKYLTRIIGSLLLFIILMVIFSGCKKSTIKKSETPSMKMIKSIKTVDDQLEQNFIVNYNGDKQVSYVGSTDFRFGYNYSYLGTQINRIEHNAGDLQYVLVLNYSNSNVLTNAEFKVKKASGAITSFPLVCTKIGDLITIATNTNDLTFLELQLSDGKLIKALTNAFYLKTSIRFKYNEEKGRVYGNVIPIFTLKNPIYPSVTVLMNELISLSLQAFSPKQLIEFQSLSAFSTLIYTQNSGDVTSIECRSEALDTEGSLVKKNKIDITYSYSN